MTPTLQTVLSAPGRLDLATAAAPAPGPHDLVIAPDAVGICGTDLELLSGRMAYLTSGFARYPIVPGHEWTGVIVDLGAAVDGFSVGDRVVGECSIGCRSCPYCAGGSYHLCPRRTETGIAGRAGALATRMVFPGHAAHRVPATVSPSDAALVEPLAVAYRGLSRLDLDVGRPLVIVGAGTIGLLCALAAQALGATDIRLVETDLDRRRFATALGMRATAELDTTLPQVVDASGSPSGTTYALDACADGGTVVLLGLTGTDRIPVDVDRVVVGEVTVHGSLGSPGVWPRVVDLISEVRPSRLVSHRFPLEDVTAAFDLADRREPGVRKIIVHPNAPR